MPTATLTPLPHDQVAFALGGREVCRWHFGADAPRPFFFPLVGPSGASLTRMGHPGAPNHDHHRSVWFAHHDVAGIDFWSDRSRDPVRPVIRQREWLCYEDDINDGRECRMAVRLDWLDGHDPTPLLTQTLIATALPEPTDSASAGNWCLDLDSIFEPTSEELELGQTNFGVVACRVSKRLSGYFGSGTLTGSDGRVGEPQLFGEPNAWVDYSVADDAPAEGVTLMSHPSNANHPPRWHVREDGWMGPSVCRSGPVLLRKASPLRLRYRLHVHQGGSDAARAQAVFAEFTSRSALAVKRSTKKHTHMEIVPAGGA